MEYIEKMLNRYGNTCVNKLDENTIKIIKEYEKKYGKKIKKRYVPRLDERINEFGFDLEPFYVLEVE